MIKPSDFHLVYALSPGKDKLQARLVSKFFCDGRNVAVLQDHGLLQGLPAEGPMTPAVRRILERLDSSSYVRVVRKQAFGPHRPQVPAVKPPTETKQDSPAFDYIVPGTEPQVLDVYGGRIRLDGQELEESHAQKVLSSVREGSARLRYRADVTQKHEAAMIETLSKAEPTLRDSMEALRQMVAAGQLPQDHYDNIRRELFESDAAPGLGNLRAYREHLENEGRGGVHLNLDLDYLKSINDTYGHEFGDGAIRAAGGAVRAAIDKTVGSGVAKAHHLHGDEMAVHLAAPEHVAPFLRQLRSELEAVPPIGGTHKLSMSVGVGLNPAHADQSLYHAKAQKAAAVIAAGGDPLDRVAKIRSPYSLHAHSLLPGSEGPVPLDTPSPLHGLPTPSPAPAQQPPHSVP